jgi:RES domain-containing protein
MPVAWRIVKAKLADRAFDGEGARRFGGRWNSPGTRVVYASETRALAVLETLVHLARPELLDAYTLIPARVPDDLVETLDPSRLPRSWRTYPPPLDLQWLGDEWAATQRTVALRIPSAVIGREHNYLLNPVHPAFTSVTIDEPETFALDPRLKRS